VTTQVSRHQKGKTNLDFTEARDSEWQWYQLGRMQVCTSLQTDNTPAPHPTTLGELDIMGTFCQNICQSVITLLFSPAGALYFEASFVK